MREEETPANFGRRAGKAKRANAIIGCSDTGVSYEKHAYKCAVENQGGK